MFQVCHDVLPFLINSIYILSFIFSPLQGGKTLYKLFSLFHTHVIFLQHKAGKAEKW